VALGYCVDVLAVAAADDTAERDVARAEEVDDGPVAFFQAAIAQGEPAQPVVAMWIDAGIVEDEVGAACLPDIFQHLLHDRQIGLVLDAIGQRDVDIGGDLVVRIVLRGMNGNRDDALLVPKYVGGAIALVHIQIDHEHAADHMISKETGSGDRDIVEGAEPGAVGIACVMAAAGAVQCKTMCHGETRRQNGAGRCRPSAHGDKRRYRKAYQPFDPLGHGHCQNLIDITRIVGMGEKGRLRRLRVNEAVGNEAVALQYRGKTRIFLHGKPVVGGKLRIIGGTVDDRRRHQGTDPGAGARNSRGIKVGNLRISHEPGHMRSTNRLSRPPLNPDHRVTAMRTSRPFDVTSRTVVSIALPMTLAFMTTPLLGIVDTAVVGQLGDAALIGGLAIGAIIFDAVFATFNFLRSATTGLVAQAIGREDHADEQAIFWRSLAIGLGLGLVVLLASPLVIAAGVAFMGPGADVRAAIEVYVSIRIVSAPAALANYAVLGFVLGRGEALVGLGLQTLINSINIVLSIWLGLGLDWGIAGVAWATVIGETVGAIAGFAFVVRRFRRGDNPSLAKLFERRAVGRLMSLNRDIMIRSMALLAAFAFFTRAGVQFGPTVLAANAILMNFFFVAGYYLDGLATAAEQIAGRAVGANHRPAFDKAIRLTVLWGFVLAGIGAGFFLVFGGMLIELMTTAPEVRSTAMVFLPWAAISALCGVLAFQMDGVFIGATWSRDMRNMMLLSLAIFLAVLFTVVPAVGNHALWAALNLFLGLRGVTLLALVPRRARETFRD
jgi:multidrug resistance protein, MATE family